MLVTSTRVFVLALIWASLQGSFDIANLLFGVLLGIGVTAFAKPIFDRSEDEGALSATNFLRRIYRFLVLFLVFLRELMLSSLRVAAITVAPSFDIRSAVVEYPLDVRTNREITVLSNLITLTPGTMTLDVSSDRKFLYIHSMSVDSEDGQEVIREIKESLERQVKLAFGPRATGADDSNE